ncbi:hypothetical protein OAO18_04480 [Francisellaceae bacterium]|nr:hypothetical protein [Francisellaceae bacterium]
MGIRRIIRGLFVSVFLSLFTIGMLALSINVKNAYAQNQNDNSFTPSIQFNDLSAL